MVEDAPSRRQKIGVWQAVKSCVGEGLEYLFMQLESLF